MRTPPFPTDLPASGGSPPFPHPSPALPLKGKGALDDCFVSFLLPPRVSRTLGAWNLYV